MPNTVAQSALSLPPDLRPLCVQYVKPSGTGAVVGPGASYTIFDSTVNGTVPTGTSGVLSGPGNVEKITMAISANADADTQASYHNATLNFYYDGAESPSMSLNIGDLIGGEFSNATASSQPSSPKFTYAQDFAGMPVNNVFSFGFFRALFVPFNTSCKIVYVNNSGSQTAGIWTQVEYRQGVIPTWKGGPGTPRAKLHALIDNAGTTLAYANVTVGPLTGISGELESIHLLVESSNNGAQTTPYFLEGHPTFTTDGTKHFEYGGTEDFFNGDFYTFGTDVIIATPFGMVDVTWGSSKNSVAWFGAWNNSIMFSGLRLFGRLKGLDELPFSSSLQFDWQNGLSTVGGGYTVFPRIVLLYYTNA